MDPDHYVPILKGKKGEFDALRDASEDTRGALTPLIEVVPPPWDWGEDRPAKDLDVHLTAWSKRLREGWAEDSPVLVDSIWLDPDEDVDGVHPLTFLFDELRGLELAAIPVGGIARGDNHADAVRAIALQDRRGACLRIDAEDLEGGPDISNEIDAWLRRADLSPGDVDLLIDMWEVAEANAGPLEIAAVAAISALPYLADWRSLIVASGAFPENLSRLQRDSETTLGRHDWDLWQSICAAGPDRIPTFSDYAIANPTLSDPDPRTMRPTASIRYTTKGGWLVVKRRWVGAEPKFAQFNDASSVLEGRSEFFGSGHCAGDAFITACAAGGPTGNLTTWRAVGTGHHLKVTVDEIASLP